MSLLSVGANSSRSSRIRNQPIKYSGKAINDNQRDQSPFETPRMIENNPHPYRSEEHTSELQSLVNLVCRLLLEKKKKNTKEILK